MTYTLKRIGFISAVRIAAIIAAAVAVLPIVILLLLNAIFKFLDVIIPPEMIGQVLASTALWAAAAGAVSTGIVVVIYNICAHYFGGISFELKAERPPRKSKEEVDID
ncbi:MAG: hypothetical protein OXE52_01735 [Chloroflexi bacterium]|nr:hypothetical protein [Chloroflexota bacterium]